MKTPPYGYGDIDLPEPSEVQALLNQGSLSGAEMEVLEEYVSQSPEEWLREISREGCTNYLLPEEMVESGLCSLDEAVTAEKGYATAKVQRVEAILQNHGVFAF